MGPSSGVDMIEMGVVSLALGCVYKALTVFCMGVIT